MRKLHRWISFVAALFLIYVAGTGALLVMDESAVALSHLVRPVLPVTPLQDSQLAVMLASTYRIARERFPNQRFLSVELRMYGSIPEGIVWTDEFTPFAYVFDTRTGQQLTPDSLGLSKFVMPWHMHQLVKRMHRGDIIGLTGRGMSLLVGLALLFLCISAVDMYWELLRRRWRGGRRALFWR